MNHKAKSILLVLFLLSLMAIIGFFVNFNEGITGGMVTKSVACYEDKECDDGVAGTEDVCLEAGTKNALCVNRPIK